LASKRGETDRPVIVGTPAEVVDIVGRYRDAGVGELIVPDFTLGPMPRRKETCDLLINEVASHFR
jgi:alkanesulfonate monooxygenase SsuD/methylene tetrahydromethanopterin reductase-like flavin-dependent oxidoreductase (luciferase family)